MIHDIRVGDIIQVKDIIGEMKVLAMDAGYVRLKISRSKLELIAPISEVIVPNRDKYLSLNFDGTISISPPKHVDQRDSYEPRVIFSQVTMRVKPGTDINTAIETMKEEMRNSTSHIISVLQRDIQNSQSSCDKVCKIKAPKGMKL